MKPRTVDVFAFGGKHYHLAVLPEKAYREPMDFRPFCGSDVWGLDVTVVPLIDAKITCARCSEQLKMLQEVFRK